MKPLLCASHHFSLLDYIIFDLHSNTRWVTLHTFSK